MFASSELFEFAACVGAVGCPVRSGEAKLAFKFSAEIKSPWSGRLPEILPHDGEPPLTA